MKTGLRGLLFASFVLVGPVPAAGITCALLVWSGEPVERGFIVGGIILFAGLVIALFAAHALGSPYDHFVHEVQLMTRANPSHRVPTDPGPGLRALANEVNRMADRVSELETERQAQAEEAAPDLGVDKQTLAEVLFALPAGLVAVDESGRVVLANATAVRLLSRPALPLRRGEPLFSYLKHDSSDDPQSASDGLLRDLERGDGSAAPLQLSGREVYVRSGSTRGTNRSRLQVLMFEDREVLLADDAVAHQALALLGREGFYDFAPALPESQPGPDPLLKDLSYVVIDLETTGLDPGVDAIVSIGAVRLRQGRVVHDDFFYMLVDPGRPIPAASSRIHGLTDADVAGRPPIEAVLPDFLEYCGSALLAGHFVAFDMAFVNPLLARQGRPGLSPALDTLLLATALSAGHEDYNLDAIAAEVGVPVVGRHTALGDALTAAEVLARQISLLESRGVRTLSQAVALQRRDPLRRVVDALRAELGWDRSSS